MTATDEGAPPIEERALLRRTTDDRMLFGVCGGLGRYLGVDPVLVRITFVLLAVFGGSGVLLYLVGLIAIPEERPDEPVHPGTRITLASGPGVVVGAVLVVLGFLLLASRVIPAFGDLFGPMVLIAAGVLVILVGRR